MVAIDHHDIIGRGWRRLLPFPAKESDMMSQEFKKKLAEAFLHYTDSLDLIETVLGDTGQTLLESEIFVEAISKAAADFAERPPLMGGTSPYCFDQPERYIFLLRLTAENRHKLKLQAKQLLDAGLLFARIEWMLKNGKSLPGFAQFEKLKARLINQAKDNGP
jgi:hypothetical protein